MTPLLGIASSGQMLQLVPALSTHVATDQPEHVQDESYLDQHVSIPQKEGYLVCSNSK